MKVKPCFPFLSSLAKAIGAMAVVNSIFPFLLIPILGRSLPSIIVEENTGVIMYFLTYVFSIIDVLNQAVLALGAYKHRRSYFTVWKIWTFIMLMFGIAYVVLEYTTVMMGNPERGGREGAYALLFTFLVTRWYTYWIIGALAGFWKKQDEKAEMLINLEARLAKMNQISEDDSIYATSDGPYRKITALLPSGESFEELIPIGHSNFRGKPVAFTGFPQTHSSRYLGMVNYR